MSAYADSIAKTIGVGITLGRLFALGCIHIAYLSSGARHAGTTRDTGLVNTRSSRIAIIDVCTGWSLGAQPIVSTDSGAWTIVIIGAAIAAGSSNAHAFVKTVLCIDTLLGLLAEARALIADLVAWAAG